MSELTFSLTLNYTIEKVILGLPQLYKVTPSAKIVSLLVFSTSVDQPFQLLSSFIARTCVLTLPHKCLTPQVKELLSAFESNAAIN